MHVFALWHELWRQEALVRLFTYLGLAWLVALALRAAAQGLLGRLARRRPAFGPLAAQAARPLRWLLPLACAAAVLDYAPDLGELGWLPALRRLMLFALIGTATWLAVAGIAGLEELALHAGPLRDDRSPRGRRLLTQIRVLSRTGMVVVTVVGLAGVLMTVPAVRQVGASLLASAGLAGLAVGFAARPVLSNVIAGLQIALTQPISLDDTVMIEGELGYVEEITGTYVVVRVWDERRLVVPLTYFIEKPISNWSRTDPGLTGAVFLWFDFRLPLDPLREELRRLVAEAPEWDGKVCLLQVADANERAMQLRILVSAVGMPAWWDLRCRVREGLIRFVNRHYPDCLPTARTRLQGEDAMQGPSPFDLAAAQRA
ncbi:mechanosensitive ion channel family protein [Frateuria defendens]|uniref:mechanosensitive ion channel family protein n=1 Tax=Frateuria defendens TaxID=2219559 RepID=UPI00066FE7FC|nr:mechanosensitive ion channel domain-containing protein [Frateuria defendens]